MNRKEFNEIVETLKSYVAKSQPDRGDAGPAVAPGQQEPRVIYQYVAGAERKGLSKRAIQVLTFMSKNRVASSRALQYALKVNRNVIAGAIHELKQANCITVKPLNEPPPIVRRKGN